MTEKVMIPQNTAQNNTKQCGIKATATRSRRRAKSSKGSVGITAALFLARIGLWSTAPHSPVITAWSVSGCTTALYAWLIKAWRDVPRCF